MSMPRDGAAGATTDGAVGLRVLVAEDLYPIAAEVGNMLRELGHQPIGPVGSVATGLAMLECEGPPDAAVLDIDLRGEPVYALAAALRSRGVPIVFATGYGSYAIPAEWSEVPRVEKPFSNGELCEALARVRATASSQADHGLAGRAEWLVCGTERTAAAGSSPRVEPDETVRRALESTKNVRNLRMVFSAGQSGHARDGDSVQAADRS